MRIENCKSRIAGVAKTAAQIFNFKFLFNLGGLLAFGALVGFASSRADEASLFSAGQARERAGHGAFPHEQKQHIKVQCADCHLASREKTGNTDQPKASDFPHAACIRCHNFAAEFFKSAVGQPSRFCAVCHEPRRISKMDKALRPGVFARPQISDFDDAFSHKAHRKILPADFHIMPAGNPPYGSGFRLGESPRCTDCHEPVRRAAAAARDMKTEASHATCFVCHGAEPPEPRSAPAETFPHANDCSVCHELRLLDARPRTRGLFGTVKGFRHDDHDLDIRPKKRSDFPLSSATDRLCAECHQPVDRLERLAEIKLPEAGYCDRCHIDNKPGLPGKLSEDVLNRLRGN